MDSTLLFCLTEFENDKVSLLYMEIMQFSSIVELIKSENPKDTKGLALDTCINISHSILQFLFHLSDIGNTSGYTVKSLSVSLIYI